MEYPRAEALLYSLFTITGNPFLEPSVKHLLEKMIPLPYHYHKHISKKF